MSRIPDLDDDLARTRRRKSEATAKGGQAFLRLLLLAEHHDSGQATRIAGFIASTYNGQVFPFVGAGLNLSSFSRSERACSS